MSGGTSYLQHLLQLNVELQEKVANHEKTIAHLTERLRNLTRLPSAVDPKGPPREGGSPTANRGGETRLAEDAEDSPFVVDTASGFYIHRDTGYYYDTRTNLYFDSQAGVYYLAEGSGLTQYALACTAAEPTRVLRFVSTKGTVPVDRHLIGPEGALVGRKSGIAGQGYTLGLVATDISKKHAEISYNPDEARFYLRDMGSRNGTFVNNSRLTPSTEGRESSEKLSLGHGDLVRFGESTEFQVHLHPGAHTCGQCEPRLKVDVSQTVNGQLSSQPQTYATEATRGSAKERLERERKAEMLRLKRQLHQGLKDGTPSTSTSKPQYRDRAALRRAQVGSDAVLDEDLLKAKNPGTALHRPLGAANKGHQLLGKMGWREGESLGQRSGGLTEPLGLQVHGRAGLGAEPHGSQTSAWDKARQRFAAAEQTPSAAASEDLDMFALGK